LPDPPQRRSIRRRDIVAHGFQLRPDEIVELGLKGQGIGNLVMIEAGHVEGRNRQT